MHINDTTNQAGIATPELIKSVMASLPKGKIKVNPVARAILAKGNDLTKGNISVRDANGNIRNDISGVCYNPFVSFTNEPEITN